TEHKSLLQAPAHTGPCFAVMRLGFPPKHSTPLPPWTTNSTHQMKQPFAIRILTWFSAFASTGMFLSILLAVMDVGPHIMGGKRVTRSEWLHIAAPLVGSIGCLMALIAYALHAGKTRSRHVVMAV